MKRLLRALLFWNASGTGVFFALGVLVVLPWLLLTWGFLWPMAGVPGWFVPGCQDFVALLLFYSLLILFLGWLRCVCHNPNRTRGLVWTAVTLCLISLMGSMFWPLMDDVPRWALVVAGVLLAACWAMHPRIRLWQSLLSLLLWGGGLMLLSMICGEASIEPGSGFSTPLRNLSWLTGHVWGLLAGAGVLAVLFAYWCAGLAIARASAVSLRRLVGWGTRALWALVGLVYVITLILAEIADFRCRVVRRGLAVYFKRSMTLTAAEEHYYAERQRAPEFWRLVEERVGEMTETLKSTVSCDVSQLLSRPLGVLPEMLHEEWKGALLANPAVAALHDQLEGEIPAAERNYSEGFWMKIPEFGWLRSLARMEMWRLRFAVEDRDSVTALEAYSRLEKICGWLEDDGLAIAQLVACRLEADLQMEALAMLASSGLAPEEWLRMQAEKLMAAEEAQPDREKMVLYFEACFLLDALRVLGHGGRVFPGEDANVACMNDLKWFLPAAWWRVAQENAEFIHHFERGSFADLLEAGKSMYLGASQNKLMENDATPEGTGGLVYNWALREWTQSWPSVEKRLKRRLVVWRVARGLLTAELARRNTGDYPETLEMPPEPFAEGNLQYFKGIVARPVYFWREDESGESYWEKRMTEAEGVEVGSVGAEGQEDTEAKDDWRKDDVKYYLMP